MSGRASIPSGAAGGGASAGHRWGHGRDRVLSSGSVLADTSCADLVEPERALPASDRDGSSTQQSPATAADHTHATSPTASVASVQQPGRGSASAVSPLQGSPRRGRERPPPRKARPGGRRTRRGASDPADGADGSADRTAGQPAAMCVLVVDDDEATARVVARLLVKLGFAVQCAADGRQGLALMGSLAEDADSGRGGALVAVLTDSSMPAMTGPQMAAAAAADPRLKRVPLVGLSGASEDVGPSSEFAKCGAVATLLKPATRFQILSALRACVARGGHAVPPALDVAIANARMSSTGEG